MNTEQLRKEFEAEFTRYGFDFDRIEVSYANDQTHGAWLAYQSAAKSRDELIERLVRAMSALVLHNRASDEREGLDRLLHSLELQNAQQALAEAKAQGYGE